MKESYLLGQFYFINLKHKDVRIYLGGKKQLAG